MNNQQMIQEIRGVVRSKLHNNGILVSIDIMKRKQEYYYNLSLSRVLSALGEQYRYVNGVIGIINSRSQEDSMDRKLLNENGSDAMLENQSDDTIEALHKLLVRK